jgi:hypothetical protein
MKRVLESWEMKMKNFKIAQIVPVAHLRQIEDNHYHMCLAHLVKNKKYASFYGRMAAEGKFVLMDNGAAEGNQLSPSELITMYSFINPTEIVLPDTLNDCVDTLRKTLTFVHVYSNLPYRFMGVPQGKNFDEWCACVEVMLREPRINTIGVSKFLNIATGNEEIRFHACAYIQKLIEELGRRDIEVHLLGCDEGPAIVKEIQTLFPFVRGCDSAFAYIATQANVEITEETERPSGEIDFINGMVEHQDLAKRLIEFENVTGVKNNKEEYSWR